MRVVRNTGYLRGRRRAAKMMVGIGVVLLMGSWGVYLFAPDIFLFAMVGLVFGFIFFNGGMQQVHRWLRRPTSDVILDIELKGLNDRHTLVHFPEVPGKRPDHVIVSPNGAVTVLTSREIFGRISARGKRWRVHRGLFGSFFSFGGPQLGNPTIENEEQVKSVTALLQREAIDVPVQGAVVFVNDNVQIELDDVVGTVLHVSEVETWLRDTQGAATTAGTGTGASASRSNADREKVVELLSQGQQVEKTGGEPVRPPKRVRAA